MHLGAKSLGVKAPLRCLVRVFLLFDMMSWNIIIVYSYTGTVVVLNLGLRETSWQPSVVC